MRVAAFVCFFLAVVIPLLLNGQTFTNSLFGVTFAIAAVSLCIASARTARSIRETTQGTRIVAVLAMILAALLLIQLPSAYTHQTNFNNHVEEMRQKRAAFESAASKSNDVPAGSEHSQ